MRAISRRIAFRIHRWLGLLLSLYVIVMGVSGSLLVFREELEPPLLQRQLRVPIAGLVPVIQVVSRVFPTRRILFIDMPTARQPAFVVGIQGHQGRTTIYCDSSSGRVLGEVPRRNNWLSFVRELHTTLLSGRQGRVINGAGGALLLSMALTGILIWWPGLTVDFRRRWRRINHDLHRAIGFWTISIVSFWALSGIYFAWSSQVFAIVNRVSPIVSAKPPIVRLNSMVEDEAKLDIGAILAHASALDPGAELAGVAFPYSRRAPFEVFMRRNGRSGREYTDTLYFDPRNGAFLHNWRYGVNQSFGDWYIWAQIPLHYGTFWGFGFKVLWALLGLSLPVLSVTGLILYWNRLLRARR